MSNLYKVDAEKGFKILCATSPAVIFVNGIRFSEINEFVTRFKTKDFDIFSIESIYNRLATKYNVSKGTLYDYFADDSQYGNHPDWETTLVSELHTFLNRFRQTPCLIYGDIGAMGLLTKIFNEEHSVFTYVYMYPNSTEVYKQAVQKGLENPNDPRLEELLKKDGKKYVDAFVKQMLDSRKKNFKVHTDALDRALVILGSK